MKKSWSFDLKEFKERDHKEKFIFLSRVLMLNGLATLGMEKKQLPADRAD